MRIVVDTNVFVSAALKASSWPGAVTNWLDEYGGLLKTSVTEREVFEVIQRPRLAGGIPQAYRGMLARMFAAAETVTIVETSSPAAIRRTTNF